MYGVFFLLQIFLEAWQQFTSNGYTADDLVTGDDDEYGNDDDDDDDNHDDNDYAFDNVNDVSGLVSSEISSELLSKKLLPGLYLYFHI